MWVALCICELHLPGARNLKDKRRVLRKVIDRAHARLRLSIAEVGNHALHQRAELGMAVVHGDRTEVSRLVDRLRTLFDDAVDGYIVRWESDIVEYPE
jgi:uncharacterized protein YlxP (DUF503 family)